MPSHKIPKSDEDLLAECEVDTFRAQGPGGQHVNRRESAVRLRHLPTGVVVVCRQERSQHRNKRQALVQLRRKLENRNWRPRTRVATSVPRHVRNAILASKKKQGAKKRLRGRPSLDD